MKSKRIQIILCLLLIPSFGPALLAQKTQPPRFEDYSADVYAGKPAPLNQRSHRLARTFRTSIREQLHDEGINFAGHYTIAVMGCGTGCSSTAIVDAQWSRIFPAGVERLVRRAGRGSVRWRRRRQNVSH